MNYELKTKNRFLASLLFSAFCLLPSAFAQKPAYPYSHGYFSTVNSRIVYADGFPGATTVAEVNAAVATNLSPCLIIIPASMEGTPGDFTGISLPDSGYRIKDERGSTIIWGFKSTINNTVVPVFTLSQTGLAIGGAGNCLTFPDLTQQCTAGGGGAFALKDLSNLTNPTAINLSTLSFVGAAGITPSGSNLATITNLADKGGQVFNVKAYGAKGDENFISDASLSSGLKVLTSVSAKFTSSMVGQSITVGGAGASGVPLTTTVASFQSSTQVTLTASASTTVTSAFVVWGGADDTASVQAAINAADSTGGGVIYFPPGMYLIAGALTLPTHAVSYSSLKVQSTFIFEGAGNISGNYGRWTTNSGSILNLTETSNTVGKFDSRGTGWIYFKKLTLADLSGDAIPFIHDTLTCPVIENVTFVGSMNSTLSQTPNQDAIVLGGTTTTYDNTAQSAFAGYGGYVTHSYFFNIQHALLEQNYVQGFIFRDNDISSGTGSGVAGDAPIVVDTQGTAYINIGGVISGNLIEATGYTYAMNIVDAQEYNFSGNNLFDAGASTLAGIHFATTAKNNIVICGSEGSTLACVDPNGLGTNNTILQNGHNTTPNTFYGTNFTGQLNVTGSNQPAITALNMGWKISDATTNDAYFFSLVPGTNTAVRLNISHAGAASTYPWSFGIAATNQWGMTLGNAGDTATYITANGSTLEVKGQSIACLETAAVRFAGCAEASAFVFAEPVQASKIRTGSASNTDVAGSLTMSAGSGSYTFTGTYTSAPICIVQDDTAIGNLLTVTVTSTTLTVTTSGAADAVSYHCIGRN